MKNKIKLPKTFNKSFWEKLGSKKEWKKHIGKPYISWSQIETFKGKTGFNTGLSGEFEYIRKYLLGEQYEDKGWGTWGAKTQEYIQERKHKDFFTKEERKVLDKIKPLDIFEQPMILDFGEFIILGFIDGLSKNWKHLRDIKTKSASGRLKLLNGENHQLELYSMFIKQEKDFYPTKIEYLTVERGGGAKLFRGGGIDDLFVQGEVWYDDYSISKERYLETEKLVREVVEKISDIYKVFLKINVK